ncbi:MAG: hypothetical protein K2X81_10660 [Candidatus Obscuribacterales bacterium]|nr:hypothetical protein [Candidatus Obscuribacterales bacterium]
MVDEKRKQLLMQLLAKEGQSGIPLNDLSQSKLLSFIRKIESIVTGELVSTPVVVYWSSADSSWITPDRVSFKNFARSTICSSAFSEHRADAKEEFFFLVQSIGLSIFIYGFVSEDSLAERVFHCACSYEAAVVKRAFQLVCPYLEFIDPPEADRLDAALRQLSNSTTSTQLSDAVKQFLLELNAPAGKPSDESNGEQAKLLTEPTGNVEESVSNLEEFWSRIANSYPYPIAYPYRTLESLTNASEKYKEQLRLVENLLAFVAGLSLAISAQNDQKMLLDLKDCIVPGVSAGHWRELIRKCTVAWKASPAKDIPLAKAIMGLRIEQVNKGFGKDIELLIRSRNDFAHHRGPTAESQIERESVKIAEMLKESMDLVGFLCEFPVKIVKAIDVLPSGRIKMTCLKATGDHPALRQEELYLDRGFPKGQLIVNAGQNHWLSLHPFISQEICSQCGSMEIYLLDKWKYDKNQIQLRSFERGHIEQSTAASDALKSMMSAVNS